MISTHVRGPGIDVTYEDEEGLINGYVDLNFYKSGMTKFEWNSILSALKLMVKYSDTPGKLVTK